MANLETLELVIRSNAESASAGINSLANSLSRVRANANSAYRALHRLNEEISRTTGAAGGSAGSAASSATAAATSATTAVTSQTVAAAESVHTATEVAREGFHRIERAAHRASSRVGRIFQTMLIRTAIRSLIKQFGEAWNAAYEFSKNMGGEFATSVDKAKALLSSTATNLVATFAPALQALLPVISTVASAIKFLCGVIQQLFSLIGLTSDLFGVSADAINKYSGAAGGGSKANKDLLASFDELNVIQSQSGGGGGGGGGSNYLADSVMGEVDALTSFIISEGMLALGFLMMMWGHPVIGAGMVALGAAGIVKTLTQDWGGLTQAVKNQITDIMMIGGSLMFVAGLILAFAGHPAIGIGLMLAGAGNLVGAYSLNFDHVVATLLNIAIKIKDAFVGAWDAISFAISLAWDVFTNWIGDIWGSITSAWGSVIDWIVGAWEDVQWAIYTAWCVVRNWWTGIRDAIGAAWSYTMQWFEGVWNSLKTAISNAWRYVEWWFNDVTSSISAAWNMALSWLISTWDNIKKAISDAWTAVSEWFNSVTSPIGAAWNTALWWLGEMWGGIETAVTDAWNTVAEWWNKNIYGNIKAAWDGIVSIFQPLLDILNDIWEVIQQINGTTVAMTVKMLTEGTPEHNMAKGLGNLYSATAKSSDAGFLERASGWVWDNIVSPIFFHAQGAYDIPKGDIFVANEAGAELVGSINGKTSVANQQQIIEGIASGVAEANSEQNVLLREQNSLLRSILQKDASVRIGASAALGRTVRQSLDMYGSMVGG